MTRKLTKNYMENFDDQLSKLTNEFNDYKTDDTTTPLESLSTYPRIGMPFEEKIKLKKEALNWVLQMRKTFPELRSLNLYLSSQFGYDTIKVFTNPDNR